jgi:predicted O-linked N-acetylglucosamine transferase (SPINDLY family)
MGYRMAPVQAAFLGFPGSSGGPEIDYIIGDPVVTPLEHAAHFSECIAQLPGCYQPNDSRRALPVPVSRADAGLPEDAVVLCAFNQPYKISPELLDVWCEVLRALPGSVLWLLEWNDQVRHYLTPELARRGMAERIIWAPPLRYAEHMARFQQADLYLDSWPCNGHTTASDALWAGVPVVTRRGATFAARVAASLNHAVGLDELVVDDFASYVECAVALGRDDARRSALQAHLSRHRREAALFDCERFARDMEALYVRRAERSAAGLAPAHLERAE